MPENQQKSENTVEGFSPWVGVWAIAAGALLLAERLGWVSTELKWGVPLLLIMFGASVVHSALRKR